VVSAILGGGDEQTMRKMSFDLSCDYCSRPLNLIEPNPDLLYLGVYIRQDLYLYKGGHRDRSTARDDQFLDFCNYKCLSKWAEYGPLEEAIRNHDELDELVPR
jgi:hypothetical protein